MGQTAEFTNRPILVTGASGFIGAHLCRRLLEAGAEVHAVSRQKQGRTHAALTWWPCDLTKFERVRSLLNTARPETIFHLAGYVQGAPEIAHVLPALQNNLQATVYLLIAAVEIGCKRIVLAGSMMEPDPGKPLAAPCSPYAASKWGAHAYAAMFRALYGLPVGYLRIFMVYGPGQKDRTKLIPYVIRSLQAGVAPRVTRGTRRVDWIYVEDVIDALLAAARRVEKLAGRPVDIGSGKLASIRAVVEQLQVLINPDLEPVWGAEAKRPLEPLRVANVRETQQLIGWSPRISLEEGLAKTVEAGRPDSITR